MSMLTDLLLWRALRRIRKGIVVSTRPSLHLALARLAPRRLTTIGWDHLNYPARSSNPRQIAVIRAAVAELDAYVVLTDADADDYRRDLPDAPTRIQVIRNSVTWPVADEPPPLEAKVVVAAGRLAPRKGAQRLVRAFAMTAEAHPDWQLHLYGRGV
jgi:glycosyltransferase involved in cell wall biosynthesis